MRRGLGFTLALLVLLVLPPAAQASFHLMKISEVGQGGPGVPDYVELQMYAPGQNLIAGKLLRTYDSDGLVQETFTFPRNVSAGDSQRTILVARNEGALPGVSPDFVSPNLVLTNEGAVCFGASMAPNAAVDCVSYGAFPGVVGGNPSSMGSPAPAPNPAQAIHRSTAPGCPALLEASDDTNDGATDFAIRARSPRPNSAAPTERGCPETTITKGPKKKVKSKKRKKKAKFSFSSDQTDATFECSLDGDPFEPCTSPFTTKVRRGKHELAVRAVHATFGTDQTPDEHAWKLKKKKKPKK